MGEETTVYFEDMETFLTPEEFQAFLRAKKAVDEYRQKKAEYDKGKADAEQSRDECEKWRDGAKSDDERRFWDVERFKYMSRVLMLSPPYYSVHYFHEHDRCIDLVRERKERKEKRLAALKEIAPPLDDAKKYLSDHEYQQFRDSVPGAIDAYLGRDKKADSFSPRAWLLNSKASDYRYWILIIGGRAREKACRKQAQLEYEQFRGEMNDSIKKMKQQLAKEKKLKFAYPLVLATHEPDSWCVLESPKEGVVREWATPHISGRIPEALRGLLSWDLTIEVLHLPYCKYAYIGVPCLVWQFKRTLLVEVRLRVATAGFTRTFRGYEFHLDLPPEDLGCLWLGPVWWDTEEGFATPVALLSLLREGKLEGDGIEVMEHEGTSISFCVQGYDESLTTIDGRFRQFIMDVTKNKSLAQGLLEAGIIDGLTAQLVGEKVKVPLPQLVGVQYSAEKSSVDNSDVQAALEALGYKKGEIKAAIEASQFLPGMSLEEKAKAVLKILAG